MVQAQAVKPTTEVTEAQTLQLTRNLLRIAIFNISYVRGLFPDGHFKDTFVGDSTDKMRVKQLLAVDVESRRLIDWMEKGVYDALQKKYLKALYFEVCAGEDGPLIEQYEFAFAYPSDTPESAFMTLSVSEGSKTKKKETKLNPFDKMRKAICHTVRMLVEVMSTLDTLPEERTIVMKLVYYDETPDEYEPPFFRACSEEDKKSWLKRPLKLKVGEVNNRHYAVALKVRSTLDPCEEENENKVDDENKTETPAMSDAETVDPDETRDDAQDDKANENDMEVDQVPAPDASTVGVCRTTGSDVTRHGQQTAADSDATVSNGGMPPSKWNQKPAISRESTVRKQSPNDEWNQQSQSVNGSRQSKQSMVEKAIHQAAKRLRGE